MLQKSTKKNKSYVYEYIAKNIKVNINKKRVIFSNLKKIKTIKYSSKTRDFDRNKLMKRA